MVKAEVSPITSYMTSQLTLLKKARTLCLLDSNGKQLFLIYWWEIFFWHDAYGLLHVEMLEKTNNQIKPLALILTIFDISPCVKKKTSF